MKSWGNALGLGLITTLICSLGAHAQINGALSPPPDSIVQITAEAQGLELVPPAEVPFFGTFWLVEPGYACPAPLPCPPFDRSLPIYAIADGQFLVDASGGQVATSAMLNSALEAQVSSVVELINRVQMTLASRQMQALGMIPSPGGGWGDGSTNYFGNNSVPQVFTTNELWLEMITVTNHTASLVIHPPWNAVNEVYDLLYCTNLAPPISWQWLLRSNPGQTNLIVPNASDAQGFYRLSSPDDLIANSSLGTNFWLTFFNMFDNGDLELSLAICSSVGATGTVTTPGLFANGPIMVVTNCGDAAVNGTYVLTNLTELEQAIWQFNGFKTNATSYVNDPYWVVFNAGYWWMFAYDEGSPYLTFLYYKPGVYLTGSAADWHADGDTNLPTPTTSCKQIMLVNRFFTVAPGAVTNISISQEAMMTNYDQIGTNGIHVVASHLVSVYGLNYDHEASTAFTGYPTKLLGTNYCVMARDSSSSQLAIVATENDTTVTITPPPTANLGDYTNAYAETLQQGETYQIQSTGGGYDVTGTLITSDKPVGIYAGASLAQVPSNVGTGNPLVQEQLPVESWGRQVLALGFAGRMKGDSYRVLAANNDTEVLTNGVVAGTIQAGQFLDLIIDGPVEFQGSQPIQVAQFANGTHCQPIAIESGAILRGMS